MSKYKAVPSGLEISRRIADCLEAAAPVGYQPGERSKAICSINDILQGRTSRTPEELLTELEKCGEDRISDIRKDAQDFLAQKQLLTRPYDKAGNGKKFVFKKDLRFDGRTLKVIDQKLYDRAAKQGFPPNFFRESYFDGMTFYCLPDQADFYGSELRNCRFAVCRVDRVSFIGTHIYDTEFYSSMLSRADFFGAFLCYVRFHDCELSHVMLQAAIMKHCSTTDCTMYYINYTGATLDGCSYGRVTAHCIRNLDAATITQGGATEEECRRNRDAIYEALGVKQVAA